MSRPDFSALRRDLLAFKAQHGDGAYRALSDCMGGTPSDEAIRLFAEGKTKAPRFNEKLSAAIGGRTSSPDLAEEAEQALRLIRQGQERLARVVERIRQLPMADDIRATVDAADASLLEPPGDPRGTRTADAAASGPRRRKAR